MKNKIIFAVMAWVLWSCSKEKPKNEPQKVYSVITVAERDVEGYFTYPVNIQGKINNDVRAKISGYITQVLVDEGQYVTQGQPLFRLETNMLNESASAAQAGIGASQSGISAAQAAVNAAQVEVDKLKPLVEKNIISNVQLETAKANLYRAQSQLKQAQAGHQQALANYKGVKANIDYSIIRAPISGVVGSLPLKVGSLVGPNDPVALTTIADTREVYAYFSMNEKEYLNFLKTSNGATVSEKLKNMPMVELVMANGEIYTEKGKIETVTGQINPSTGSIQFRVAFPNGQKMLTNGSSGKIRVPNRYDDVLIVPESSTYEQQGVVYAYKVTKDTAKSVVIEVQDRVNNRVVVKSGLKKGDMVVASGIGGLKSGTAIKSKPANLDSLVNAIEPIFK
ncbi:efflux RND transporter periplasmic adaptor subunit [Bergeyella zoohelcum]|uniref:Efflux transporter, RND family, MFP subunit n=2 Tax=Bergeyella zoohelcum TaxID=1015 RepID=K1LLL6_9FLAO|nr:efflux RND transporter periplasmic adaptor subunit [Bergeyella zoohelcum]EKB55541.1 efflux transporter, RND family, MFP subunit [Bergeyella zoohelcum ATCC 43767]EKB58216.1 efflux transporter, RND family, MFP subunit [Bergeyella zoohelcum CCUG 30536]SSZ55841.1 Efflux pump periplasmic linker BepF [Bergeyella zoohelcum]SUV50066.1 Efflux pump periplasmic linker BepF [Bergeyella zoohelcum]VDH04822.1 RND efflux system, membrane fusion protein CmeA [Bergeyella zoohelcum]